MGVILLRSHANVVAPCCTTGICREQ